VRLNAWDLCRINKKKSKFRNKIKFKILGKLENIVLNYLLSKFEIIPKKSDKCHLIALIKKEGIRNGRFFFWNLLISGLRAFSVRFRSLIFVDLTFLDLFSVSETEVLFPVLASVIFTSNKQTNFAPGLDPRCALAVANPSRVFFWHFAKFYSTRPTIESENMLNVFPALCLLGVGLE